MRRKRYPILEFDPARDAVIQPSQVVKPADVPERCVLCFFREVLVGLEQGGQAQRVASLRSEIGEIPVYVVEVNGVRVAAFQPGVGAALGAGLLEEIIAMGCRKFIACGGAGVLRRDIAAGHLVVPTSAVRDEGTSYHYLAPAREVAASPEAVAAVERVLQRRGVPYLVGKTWTTDAPYRETPDKVRLRRAEGCLTVEMEAAAFFAVAQFRGVPFAQILYGGDDVSGLKWDPRGWHQRTTVRETLFWLAAEACAEM
ncbi:MAG: nucleoside phosphorylase [Anaerolineales bacterium]